MVLALGGLLPAWLLAWLGRMRCLSREIPGGLEPDAAEPGGEGQALSFGGLGEHRLVLRRHADAEGFVLRPHGGYIVAPNGASGKIGGA